MSANKKRLTTNFGKQVDDDQNSVTAGVRGPVLLQDVHLIENWPISIVNGYLNELCMPKELGREDILRLQVM
jgi:hypothetical protein